MNTKEMILTIVAFIALVYISSWIVNEIVPPPPGASINDSSTGF